LVVFVRKGSRRRVSPADNESGVRIIGEIDLETVAVLDVFEESTRSVGHCGLPSVAALQTAHLAPVVTLDHAGLAVLVGNRAYFAGNGVDVVGEFEETLIGEHVSRLHVQTVSVKSSNMVKYKFDQHGKNQKKFQLSGIFLKFLMIT
jgi:hypothetical protein